MIDYTKVPSKILFCEACQKKSADRNARGGFEMYRYDEHLCDEHLDFRRRWLAKSAVLERQKADEALGAAVRSVLGTGGHGSGEPQQLEEYARDLGRDRSLYGAAVFRAIADALRVEK